MEVFILVGLILLNGIFAMSEIAVVTAKRGRLQALVDQGNSAAASALKLVEEPTRFLSTVQIGITSISIMNGIFGESVLAEPFAVKLQAMGLPQNAAGPLATALVIIVVTYISIVVGELVPKRIGQMSAERVSCIIARPMGWIAVGATPLIKLLTFSTQTLLRILGFQKELGSGVTEDDIHAMLREGSETGVIEMHEHAIVKSVFRFDERTASSLMVPRSDVVFLDIAQPWEENYQRIMNTPHSRYPVCDSDIERPIGAVTAKDLLFHSHANLPIDLQSLAKPCLVVHPNINAMELLRRFRQEDHAMAFILDEYGVFKGLVALQDLLEALTGDYYSDTDKDALIIRRQDGSYLLDGLLPVIDLEDLLGLTPMPKDRSYQTLSGLIMALMDELPKTGDIITLDGWQLEIVDMDGRRIDKVLASLHDNEEEQSSGE